jgi:hypothetical protein
MKATYHIVIFFLLFVPCLEAQEAEVSVRTSGKRWIKSEPRRIAAAVFQVTNETSEKREFSSAVKLPEGWTLISKHLSFELGPNESNTRLVSFSIPQRTLAGHYELTYFVKGKNYPSLTQAHTLYVLVLPVNKLEVKLLEAPAFAMAGDDYQASFAVMNESNIENNLVIGIESTEELPSAVDAEELKLAPGESRTLRVAVRTDKNRTNIFTHHLRLTAQVLEDKEIIGQATSHVQILPRTPMVGERFHKIPTEMAFRYVTKRNEEDDAGLQAEISGVGTLDEEGNQGIRFLFRGPDIRNKSIFGIPDEYHLSFWKNDYKLCLGDHVYSVSPLIERYGYGRGIEGTLNLSNFQVGAYHMKTRWRQPEEEHSAGYIDYSVLDKLQVGLNYIRKVLDGEDEKIASMECRLGPLGNTDVELEYALGWKNSEKAGAYRLEVSGHWPWISYFSRVIHAGPDAIYYRDMDFATVGLALRLKNSLTLKTSLQQEKKNLALDATLGSAPFETCYSLGLDYRLKTGSRFYAFWRDRSREDRFPDPDFIHQEETIVFGAGQSLNKLSLLASVESGQRKDKLSKQSSALERYKASAYFRPTVRQSYSAYAYYDYNGNCSEGSRHRITAGLNSSLRIASETLFSLILQISDYEGPHSEARDILEMSLSHRFGNQSEIRLRGRHTSYKNSEMEYGSALKVEYTIPFGLPIAKKKNVGTVKGYVYDEESNLPIPDVILKIDNATALTNRKGRFSFASVRPGMHYLNVSTAGIGLDRIAVQKTPIEVNIKGGKETWLEIGISRSASLSGQVALYRFENNHNSDFAGDLQENHHVIGTGEHNGAFYNGESKFHKTHGMKNILVELRNDSEVMRRLTDREGRFEFEEIRPGEWTLQIPQDHLPEYHYFETDALDFELKPGEKKNVSVKVLPKKRPIHIFEEGGILLEEEAKSP